MRKRRSKQWLNQPFDQTNAAAFEHVTFKYTETSDPVLEDIDFTIPKGKTTAIVGGTESGKVAWRNFLRLSDPTIGKVTLGGIPLTQMTQEQIRSPHQLCPSEGFLIQRDNFKATCRWEMNMPQQKSCLKRSRSLN